MSLCVLMQVCLCVTTVMIRLDDGPHPLLAWPSSPLEVRVALDAPLDPAALLPLTTRRISLNLPVPPGLPARDVSLVIAAARLEDNGRTLILATDPHAWNTRFTLPAPFVGMNYTLDGVEAAWEPNAPDPNAATLPIWWPALDLNSVRQRTEKSAAHKAFLTSLDRPGLLTLRTFLALPPGRAIIHLEADGPVRFDPSTLDGLDGTLENDGRRLTFNAEIAQIPPELFLIVRTGVEPNDAPPTLSATVETLGRPARPLQPSELQLPWSPPPPPVATAPSPLPDRLAGGDPQRGETIFFAEESKCSTCHRVGDRGGKVGPAVADFRSHDIAWIAREIAEPSATIHPDFVPYTVSLDDGRVLAGIIQSDGPDHLNVIDTAAQITRIPRAEIDDIRPSATSIMPVGLTGVIGDQQLKDLLAYLAATP